MVSNATKNKKRKGALATNTTTLHNDEDGISKLPDNVLTHVLSFLPTKDAVRTSVLSKRWTDLWTFIINLDFDDELPYYISCKTVVAAKRQHFVNFVNNVLQRLSSSSINDVTLIFDGDKYPQRHIDAWMSTLLRMGVRKLYVRYCQSAPVNFCALFHSISLEELKIQIHSTFSRVPSNSCLINLQILNISYTKIVGDAFQSKEMVFNFPVLKVFEVRHCSWLETEKVILNAPKLESFLMIHSFLTDKEGRPFLVEPWIAAIKIFAPHLRKLIYRGPLLEDIILSDPTSILHVFLEIESTDHRMTNIPETRQPFVRACLLLKELQHCVETMQLGYKLLMKLCHPNDQLLALPMFSQLVCLMLNLAQSPLVLLNILHKLPVLRKLLLFCTLVEFDRELFTSEVPPCLVSSLKTIEIQLDCLNEGNVFLAKYLLEKASVLERLTINISYKRVSVKKLTRELLSSPKASENISIKVEKTPPFKEWTKMFRPFV